MDLRHHIFDDREYITGLRRALHACPEPALQEKETARMVGGELTRLGIPWQPLPPGHGLVGVIRGGKPGKTVMLRADMDALKVAEKTGLPFASKNDGFMHACGHDAHMAMLLGAANALQAASAQLGGTVLCVFQGAEEIGQGHEEVLEYLRGIGGVDAALGLHIWSLIPEGEILLPDGPVFAGVRTFRVSVKGRGGHSGRPDLAADPIRAACELVLKFASIPVNQYDALDHAVVSVGLMEAGTAGNVFPSEAKLHGSLRWFKPGGEQKVMEAMERIARGVGEIYGVECAVEFLAFIPPVVNDPALSGMGRALVPSIPGLAVSASAEPIIAGDNMGAYLREYPGFYGILGGGKKEGAAYPHHHEEFDIDEGALVKGAALLAQFAADFLG